MVKSEAKTKRTATKKVAISQSKKFRTLKSLGVCKKVAAGRKTVKTVLETKPKIELKKAAVNLPVAVFNPLARSIVKVTAMLLIVMLNWFGLSAVGRTLAYLSDVENSSENNFIAGDLDFVLESPADFAPSPLKPGESASRTINVINNGNPFKYIASSSNFSSPLCDYLTLEANVDGDLPEYVGSLKDFTFSPLEFSDPDAWEYKLILSPDTPNYLNGATCNFKFVYFGSQTRHDLPLGGGFNDIEEIDNSITAKIDQCVANSSTSSAPLLARLDDGTVVTSQVKKSDNVYAIQAVSSVKYIYLDWAFLGLPDNASTTIAKLTLEHQESGVNIAVEWNDGANWVQVCDPPEVIGDTISTCDLQPYLNNTDKAKNVNLRLKLTQAGTCHEYLDWAKLEIGYEQEVPCDVCGNGILEEGEQCDDGNIAEGDGCSATCQKECPTKYITKLLSGSVFNYTGYNVVIRNGGELRGACSELTVITDCSLTVESGGKISHSTSYNGENINLLVGQNLIVNGAIEATGGSGSNVTGGNINISASGTIAVGSTGIINASAEDHGGKIVIKAKENLIENDGGKILANSSAGVDGDNGGTIAMEVGQDLTVDGLMQVNGQSDNGGIITASVNGKMTEGVAGSIQARSNNGTEAIDFGGKIALKVDGQFDINGEINAFGYKNGGQIDLWSADNINIIGSVLAQGLATGTLEKYGGYIDVITHKELNISGNLNTIAKSGNGFIKLYYHTNNFTGMITPMPTELVIAPVDILLNEIMAYPSGGDDGQWVELYNNSGLPIDVANWYLYDGDDTHTGLKIDATNASGGNTIIPAGGLLVVNRNGNPQFVLSHNRDTVKLQDNSGVYNDAFTFIFNLGANKSYARFPNGIGPWYDPDPTPDLPNQIDADSDYDWLYSQININLDEYNIEPIDEPINEPEIIIPLISEQAGTSTDPVVPVEEEALINDQSPEESVGTSTVAADEQPASDESVDVPTETTEPVVEGNTASTEPEIVTSQENSDTSEQPAVESEPAASPEPAEEVVNEPASEPEPTMITEPAEEVVNTPVVEPESQPSPEPATETPSAPESSPEPAPAIAPASEPAPAPETPAISE